MSGNAAFAAGELRAHTNHSTRRAETASVQLPFAMVLACADSRVAPELIFDCTLGDLFVCRVAGNILEPGTLASFEYAVSQFESVRALVVVGHQRCGAVTATLAELRHGAGAGSALVESIRPIVESTEQGSITDDAYVDAVVDANARYVCRAILAQSTVLEGAVGAGRLEVVPARYSLDSGRVTLLT